MSEVGFDIAKLTALSTAITDAMPGLGDLDREITTLRTEADADMGGTPVPSDAGLTSPSNEDVALGLLDVSTEIKRRLQLISSIQVAERLGFDIDTDPMALDLVDDAKVSDVVSAIQALPGKDTGINGNRDDIEAIQDQLSHLNGEEMDALLDQLDDDDLGALAEMARSTDDSGWSPFDHNGLERPERFALFGSILSQVSPSRIDRVVTAFPELNPGFDSTDGALDRNSQTGESAQGLHYGDPDGTLWRLDADGNPVVDASEANQGSLGDCWFIASMLSAQGADPTFIPDHMQQNPNGTISVKMYDDDGDPHWTTVTEQLPLNEDGSLAMGRGEQLWGAYYEKAFAQLYSDDDGGASDDHEGDPDYDRSEVGTYGALEWDFTKNAAPYISGHDSDEIGHDFDDTREAFDEGRPVLISTPSDAPEPPEDWGPDYSTRHVYYVVATSGDTITVGNPWGPDREITMTREQYDTYFDSSSAMQQGG